MLFSTAKPHSGQRDLYSTTSTGDSGLMSDATTLPLISLHLTEYLPPIPLVVPSYVRLKVPAKQHLLMDWGSDLTPDCYHNPPASRPYSFIGMGKFIASQIHYMDSVMRYLAAHTLCENPNPDSTCPRYSNVLQSFEHAMLFCPSAARQISLLLQGVLNLGPEAPILSD